METRRDESLDTLLSLDGETFVIDEAGRHSVKFEVRRCGVSAERPHGLRYSLTLHDRAGERLVGFDNAHPAGGGTKPGAKKGPHDHSHRLRTVRPYDYTDAGLLAGFWAVVEAVLDERGVKR